MRPYFPAISSHRERWVTPGNGEAAASGCLCTAWTKVGWGSSSSPRQRRSNEREEKHAPTTLGWKGPEKWKIVPNAKIIHGGTSARCTWWSNPGDRRKDGRTTSDPEQRSHGARATIATSGPTRRSPKGFRSGTLLHHPRALRWALYARLPHHRFLQDKPSQGGHCIQKAISFSERVSRRS